MPQIGSIVTCDAAPGKEGRPQPIAVHSIEEPILEGTFIRGQVRFFDTRKDFGFVVVDEIPRDIYLSYHVLKSAGHSWAAEGATVEVVVSP